MITVAVTGDHGKPRPAVVIQTDDLETATVLVCLITSDIIEAAAAFRLALEPTKANGLRKPSLVQADKIYPVPRRKCGAVIGALAAKDMSHLNILLAFVLGLGD